MNTFLISRWFTLRIKRSASYLLRYTELQLFIQLCAWPIFAAWGIPLAPAGLLGNLLFGPCISLFLGISSVIFMLELLSLPSSPLCTLLDYVTTVWHLILSQGNRSWLYAGAHPPFIITLLLPVSACIIMMLEPLRSRCIRILFFIVLYGTAGYCIPRYFKADAHVEIPFGKGNLTFIQKSATTILIDPGVTGQSSASTSLVTYRLLPWLSKQGITQLDHVVITRVSTRVVHVLARLLEQFPVKNLYLPGTTLHLSNRGWGSLCSCLSAADLYQTKIITINTPTCLTLSGMELTLHPSHQKKGTRTISYSVVDLPHSKTISSIR